MPARVVCISSTLGSHGADVCRAVAAELGFRLVDEEIVKEAARRENLDPSAVADVEQRRSVGRRLLRQIGARQGETRPSAGPVASAEHVRELIRETIRDTADAGDVVIASHAASVALAGMPDLLRVLVTASDEIRARRVEGADVLGFDAARRRVAADDEGRAHYLRRFYGVERETPTLYDLVVSTDVLGAEQAASAVAAAARA